ncbi:MAG: P1 family peptidase [Anaerolineae bacterium]|nr:P1 family peptidase [Anaerolineae bacterium]
MINDTLTAVPGIRVGHTTHLEGATGCTVVLCPEGTVAGVDQRGGAPGTRETDLLHPMHLVEHVHAVLLAGGSAFGLAAADGVMRFLEERGIGYPTRVGPVPIVPAAILFDLTIGSPTIRPDAAMGYAACEFASDAPVALGSVGAGTGCRVGALQGNEFATKGGIGSASIDLGDGLVVAALIAVNAFGDVVDEGGKIIAGMRDGTGGFPGVLNMMRFMARMTEPPASTSENTVIGVVATNARLTKEQVNKVAQMAHDGLAQSVRPAHTMFDGDTIFALATGSIPANVNVIGAFAAEATAQAVRSAVQQATSLAGVRSIHD